MAYLILRQRFNHSYSLVSRLYSSSKVLLQTSTTTTPERQVFDKHLNNPSLNLQQCIKEEKEYLTKFVHRSAFAKWRMRIYNELESYHQYKSISPAAASISSNNKQLPIDNTNDQLSSFPIGAEQFGSYFYYCIAHEHHDFPVWYRQHQDHLLSSSSSLKNSSTKLQIKSSEIEVLDTYLLAQYGKNKFANVGTLKPSYDVDQRYVAWTVDLDGSETYTLFIRDMNATEHTTNSKPNSSYTWLPNEVIPNAINFVWKPTITLSSPGFFYTVANPVTKRAYKVMYHELGTDCNHDICIYTESDESKFVDIAISKDQSLITIQINDRDSSEVYIIYHENKVIPTPICLLSRNNHIQYFVEHYQGYLIMVTNAHNNDNYKIMYCNINNYLTNQSTESLSLWSDLYIPPQYIRILDVDIFNKFIVVYQRNQGIPCIKILYFDHPIKNPDQICIEQEQIIPLPSHISGIDPGINSNPAADQLRFTVYTSISPESDYEYTISSNHLRKLNEKIVGKVKGFSVYNPKDYTSYTIMVPSYSIDEKSIVDVPLTLVHHRNIGISEQQIQARAKEINQQWRTQPNLQEKILHHQYTETWSLFRNSSYFHWPTIELQQLQNQTQSIFSSNKLTKTIRSLVSGNTSEPNSMNYSHPTLFHVYGAYGHDLETHFSTNRLPLLQRNWILAFAHVRGGKEQGASWYYDGRGKKKLNSMYDALACVHMLISLGITDAQSLACRTESAGSIIGGWLSNKYPSLIQTHIYRSPFLNVVNAMLDPSLPLTVPEYQEWGNPLHDTTIRKYMESYNPYDTVPDSFTIDKQSVSNKTMYRLVYPHIYMDAAVSDPRVSIEHSLAYLQKLRTNIQNSISNTNDGSSSSSKQKFSLPYILTQIHEEGSGHFGPSGRSSRMQDRAQELTFLLSTVGKDKYTYHKDIMS